MVKASKKRSRMTFIEVDVFRRMGAAQVLYVVLHDLDVNFQGQTFQEDILTSRGWKKCKHYYCHQIGRQVVAIEWCHCECCTSWPWITFSRSWNLKCAYFENVESEQKNTQVWLLQSLTFVIEWDHCECATSWPLPKFSRSNISSGIFLDNTWKMQTIAIANR